MRLVIAGVSSGAGKTTIATGLIGALRQQGLRVQPFKAGPDYIDPSYHSRTAGVPSRNLDSWMLDAEALRELYCRAAAGADIAILEGVMGLYDGCSARDDEGSTAHLAKLLDAPVLLVIDAAGMARSAAALVLGYQKFDPALRLAGVIANNVGGDVHRRLLAEAIQETTGLPLLGAIPRRPDLTLPERHLGLIPTVEGPASSEFFANLVSLAVGSIDWPLLFEIARTAPPIAPLSARLYPPHRQPPCARIAVAQDEAFSFYYQDNLDLLTAWGAELVPFSPMHDPALPASVGGLYIGGGFPEVYANTLAANRSMCAAVAQAARDGMPVYSECGGLMYLGQYIVDFEGTQHNMVGLLPYSSLLRRDRLRLGYRTVRARRSTFLLDAGETVRGHEFHWSDLVEPPRSECAAYDILEQEDRVEGYVGDNVVASYVHLHFGAYPPLARRFVSAAASYQAAGAIAKGSAI